MKAGLLGRTRRRDALRRHTANFCSILKAQPVRLRRQLGFSLIELAVTITIAAILLTALLTRVWFYQREVERIAVEQVVRALHSALHLQLVSLTVRGRMNELPGLAEQNPVDWLERKPPNYLGAFYGPAQDELEPGNWYFDKKERRLVYLYSRGDSSDAGTPNHLSFRIKLVNNRDSAVRQDGRPDLFNSAVFEQVVQ
ncbi:MAG: hypothetical protein RL748_4318 [Pseudomonadota bacterium]